jgi:hypothetical protein
VIEREERREYQRKLLARRQELREKFFEKYPRAFSTPPIMEIGGAQ